MRDSIKEEIGIWKEILRALLYVWILEISATIARFIKYKIDLWCILGIIGIFFIGIIFLIILDRLMTLKNKLKEYE